MPTPSLAPQLPPVHILIADDQPHELLLKGQGYSTHAVDQPAQVLRALESGEFDVVLMDLNYTRDTTSGNEGLELVSQIRARDAHLPLVVMTAWSNVDLAVEAMRRGASDFVQKPWQNRQLAEKLAEQVERHRALRWAQRLVEDEQRQARQIQNKLLPGEIPQVPGYEVAGCTQPVCCVGGDYYDVVRLEDSRLALCIADVAGKGLPAALLMSNLQAVLKPLVQEGLAPRELCRRLNQRLCEVTPLGMFVSFFYAVLDTAANHISYCNAGHNPPLLIPTSGVCSELNAAGAVLGQFPDWVYEQSELRLCPGDRLVLFTDGLVEACNPLDEPFGENRLMAFAQSHAEKTAPEFLRELLDAACEHCGGRFQDDASALIVSALERPGPISVTESCPG
jgi:sigma-B regulation protein RsbU (phosphoserine phosphatase)